MTLPLKRPFLADFPLPRLIPGGCPDLPPFPGLKSPVSQVGPQVTSSATRAWSVLSWLHVAASKIVRGGLLESFGTEITRTYLNKLIYIYNYIYNMSAIYIYNIYVIIQYIYT